MSQSLPPPELSRPLRIDEIAAHRHGSFAASQQELTALARRFGLRGLNRMDVSYGLEPAENGWLANGRIVADVVQACAATGQDVPAAIDTPFTIRFVEETGVEGDEIELSADDCDTMPIEQGRFDMGEAAAQTLALALDPFPRAPDAEAWLKAHGVRSEDEAGPLGGLRDLLSKGK
jgi:uncharacterized metal-binding protein YceD (DUF177 family)